MILFLNDIAGSEVLVILIFILIFFGSKSIPGIAKTMGQTMRQIRDASNELQQEIKKSGMDIKKDINLSAFVDDTVREIQQPLDQYVDEIENAVRYEVPRKSHLHEINSLENTVNPTNQSKEMTDNPMTKE